MTIRPEQVTVFCLDDNRQFLKQAFLLLEQLNFDLHTFERMGPFVEAVAQGAAPLVLFVDHDLGAEGTGYDAVKAARLARSDGLIVPIVYLTGRETPEGYVAAQARDPFASPSMYMTKRSLGSTDLDQLVVKLLEQYEAAVRLADGQALRRAADAFTSLTEDDLDRLS